MLVETFVQGCAVIPSASIFGSSGNNIHGWCEMVINQLIEDVLPKKPPPFPGRQYMSCSGHVSVGMCELQFVACELLEEFDCSLVWRCCHLLGSF